MTGRLNVVDLALGAQIHRRDEKHKLRAVAVIYWEYLENGRAVTEEDGWDGKRVAEGEEGNGKWGDEWGLGHRWTGLMDAWDGAAGLEKKRSSVG